MRVKEPSRLARQVMVHFQQLGEIDNLIRDVFAEMVSGVDTDCFESRAVIAVELREHRLVEIFEDAF